MKNANRTVVVFIAILVLLVMPATADAVSVTRNLPDYEVSPGDNVTVTLNQSGFGNEAGIVTEILPDGFMYVSLSASGSRRPPAVWDKVTNELKVYFEGETTVTYVVERTAEQIEKAEFSGTWKTFDPQMEEINGTVGGNTSLTLAEAEPTPTPTATAAPSGGNGVAGGGGGGIPPAPPAETLPYVHLNATPTEIPADEISTSTITASVWDGDKWVMENLTVNFSADSGEITASAAIVNGTATGILTAGTEEGIANVTAEANLSGDIGVLNATTTVNFTTPGVTPTPTATPEVTATETPAAVETPTATPTPAGRWGVPGFEGIFAVAGLLAVAYLVLMRRRRG